MMMGPPEGLFRGRGKTSPPKSRLIIYQITPNFPVTRWLPDYILVSEGPILIFRASREVPNFFRFFPVLFR